LVIFVSVDFIIASCDKNIREAFFLLFIPQFDRMAEIYVNPKTMKIFNLHFGNLYFNSYKREPEMMSLETQ
jgi:hypothetical protein